MSYGYPVVIRSDKVARSQPQQVTFYFKITGAKTNASLALINNPVLLGYDAADMTQAKVETFLGHTSSAANATIFDSTSLGTDGIGFVVDMQGQADLVYGAVAVISQTAGGTPANSVTLIQATQGALSSSLSSAIAIYDGDFYGRIIAGNLDAATAGHIELRIMFKPK
jgi:hypothetical protein